MKVVEDYPTALLLGQSSDSLAIRFGEMHNFREISHLSARRLVHSQKNHGLAYNYADLLLWQVQQNKRSSLFLNGNMICIKNIQNARLLLSRQFENHDR